MSETESPLKQLIERVNATKIDEITEALRSSGAYNTDVQYSSNVEFLNIMINELKSMDTSTKASVGDHLKSALRIVASHLDVDSTGSDTAVSRKVLTKLQELTGQGSMATSKGSSYLLSEFKKVRSLAAAAEKLTKESVEDAQGVPKYDPALLTQAREAVFGQMTKILDEIAEVSGFQVQGRSDLSILQDQLEAFMEGKRPLELRVPEEKETDVAVLLQSVLSGLSAAAARDLRMAQHARVLNAALKDFQLADENPDKSRELLVKLASGAESADPKTFLESLKRMEQMKMGGNPYVADATIASAIGAAPDAAGTQISTMSVTPNLPEVDLKKDPLETIKATKKVLQSLRSYYAKLLSRDINDINVSLVDISNAVRTGRQSVTPEFREFLRALKAVENFKFYENPGMTAEVLMKFYERPELRAERERFLAAYGNLIREAAKFPSAAKFVKSVKQLHADIPILDRVMESKINGQINIPRMHLRRMEMANASMKRPRNRQRNKVLGGAFGRAEPVPDKITMEAALAKIDSSVDYAQSRLSTELSANTNNALSDAEYTKMLASEAASMIQSEEAATRSWAAIYAGDVDGKLTSVSLEDDERALADAFATEIARRKAAVSADDADNSEYVSFVNRCKLASALRDRQYQSRKQFIEVAQKIDLAAKRFHRDSLSKNDIADLQQQISEVGMSQPTYSLDCANSISALLASFVPSNNLGVDSQGKSRLLRAQEHPLDFVKSVDDAAAPGAVPLTTERQLRALLSLATRAVNRFKILDLIVAIYAKTAGVDDKTATTIKTKFAAYMVYSAFALGPTDKTSLDADLWLNISLAKIPGAAANIDGRVNDFRNTDELFQMCLKTLMAKILIAARVADVYKNPLSRADKRIRPHPLAMIVGGSVGTVRPEVAELYLALPAIAMFYHRLIEGSRDPDAADQFRFELIPTRDGTVFARFIEIMWRQSSLSSIGDSDARELIDAINSIYDHFKGENRTAAAVAALRADINSKIAMLTGDEADALRDQLSAHLQKPDTSHNLDPATATAGSDMIVDNADDLLGDIDAPSSSITAGLGKRPSADGVFKDLLIRQKDSKYADKVDNTGDVKTIVSLIKNSRAAMVSGSSADVRRFDDQARRLRNNLLRAQAGSRFDILMPFLRNGNNNASENVDERVVLLIDYLVTPVLLLADMSQVALKIAEGYANLVDDDGTTRGNRIINLAKQSRVPNDIPAVVAFSEAVRDNEISVNDLLTAANAYGCSVKFTRTGFSIDWSPFKSMAERLYKAALGSAQRLRSVYSTTPRLIDQFVGVAEARVEKSLESARELLIDSFVGNKYGIGVDVLNGFAANSQVAVDARQNNFTVNKTFPENAYGAGTYEPIKFDATVNDLEVMSRVPAYDPSPLRYTAGPQKAIQRYPNLMAGFKDSSVASDSIREGMQKVISGIGGDRGLEAVIGALRVPYARIWYTRVAAHDSVDDRVKLNYLIDATIRLGLSEGRIYSPLLQNFVNNAKTAEYSQLENVINDIASAPDVGDVVLGQGFLSATLAAVLKNTMGKGPDASAGTFVVTDSDQLDIIHRRRILRTLPYLMTMADQLCRKVANSAAAADATENSSSRRHFKTLSALCEAFKRSLRVGAESLQDKVLFAVDKDSYLESNAKDEFRGSNIFTAGVSKFGEGFLDMDNRSILVDEAVRALYMDKPFSWDLAPSFKNTIDFHNSVRPERSLDVGHALTVQTAVFDACRYASKISTGFGFVLNKNRGAMDISGYEAHLEARRIDGIIEHSSIKEFTDDFKQKIRGAKVGGALGDADSRALFGAEPDASVNASSENNFAVEVFNNFRMMPVDSSIMTRFVPWANLMNFSLSYETLVMSLISGNAKASLGNSLGNGAPDTNDVQAMHRGILDNHWFKFDRDNCAQFYALVSGDYSVPRAQFVYDVVLDRVANMSVGTSNFSHFGIIGDHKDGRTPELYSFRHDGPTKMLEDKLDVRNRLNAGISERLNIRLVNSMSSFALMFRLIDMTLSARVRNTKATKLTLSAMVNGTPSGLGPLESVVQTEDSLDDENPVISSGLNINEVN